MRMSWPWAIAGVGTVAVVGLIAFLIIQAGGGSATNFDDEDIAAEADDSPELPGEYIDLPAIYGGPYPETGGHLRESIDYEAEGNSNPPTGGPHWNAGCGDDPSAAPAFCGPAPWGIYREPWDPETLVHNMEHGGVVIWYNSDDGAVRDQLEQLVLDSDADLLVLAPYPDMEDETVAITSWTRIDKFPVAELTEERVNEFIDTHLRRFNPEHL